MDDVIQKLRALNDGVARPVTILEREVCGEAADEIERLREAIQFAHSEGFQWPTDPLAAR